MTVMEKPSGEQQFYIRVRGQVQGPFDAARLRSLATRGRFSRVYEVSSDGVAWSRAANYPELFPPPPPMKVLRQTRSDEAGQAASHSSAATALSADVVVDAEEYAPVESGPDQTGPAEPLWSYARNMQEMGPVSFSQLQLLAVTGKLLVDDPVWTDGMPEWIAAQRVPGLFAAASLNVAVGAAGMPGGNSLTLQRTAPMAVASLVLSLIGINVMYLIPISVAKRNLPLGGVSVLLLLTSVLAVVFGHVAQRQIKQSAGALTGGGMLVAGLILGYLVIISVSVVGIVLGFILLLGANIALFGNPPQA
ncbi:MAG: DUF4339 domain-containing protein [Planctomycetaceae bacterium]|nr:DUF4339 domain-containing protein [Planctomycetaceae bacterium]